MITIIRFFSRAVNHSVKGLAGTEYATRPVAMHCPGLAELIRSLPSGILLPPCPSHPAHFCFSSSVFILISTSSISLFLLIPSPPSPGPSIYLICRLKNVMLPYKSTGRIRSEVWNFMLFSHEFANMTKCFISANVRIQVFFYHFTKFPTTNGNTFNVVVLISSQYSHITCGFSFKGKNYFSFVYFMSNQLSRDYYIYIDTLKENSVNQSVYGLINGPIEWPLLLTVSQFTNIKLSDKRKQVRLQEI